MKLRDYQQEAVDAVLAYWGKGGSNPLVEVPTGGGKSAILGELARVVVEECGGRVVIATHRAELIEQDAAACRRVWPMAPLAVWSASLNKRGIAPITVCGVQTVARKARDLGVVDVLIVDEAHLIPPEGAGQYQTLVRGLRETNPGLRIVGLTATPYRLGQGYLTQGDGALFSSIVYRVDIGRLVAAGHLAPLVTGNVGAQIDTSQLAIRAGEFAARDLELAADISEVTERVADDVAAALASGRTSALLFGCSVAHAEHLRDALGARDVECAVITGETEQFTRQAIIGRFRRRELAALASCDVLTTGFDAPCVDVLAVVRATASPSLYVQIVGRGMRPADGKADCLVLDYGGNIARHGPVDEVKIRPKSKGEGKSPTKTCDSCAAEQPAGARVCSECDYEFPPPEKKANTEASALPVLSKKTERPHFRLARERCGLEGEAVCRLIASSPDGITKSEICDRLAIDDEERRKALKKILTELCSTNYQKRWATLIVCSGKDEREQLGGKEKRKYFLADDLVAGAAHVGKTTFHEHRKKTGDGPPTLRVDYYAAEPEAASSSWVPMKIASEWICVEHDGFARAKAEAWWSKYVGTRMPATVAEAVERLRAGEMPRVLKIETRPDGDYTRVVRLRQEAGRQPGEDDEVEEPQAAEAEAVPIDPWNTDDLPF